MDIEPCQNLSLDLLIYDRVILSFFFFLVVDIVYNINLCILNNPCFSGMIPLILLMEVFFYFIVFCFEATPSHAQI